MRLEKTHSGKEYEIKTIESKNMDIERIAPSTVDIDDELAQSPKSAGITENITYWVGVGTLILHIFPA